MQNNSAITLLLEILEEAFIRFEQAEREGCEQIFWHSLDFLPDGTRELARCLRNLAEIHEQRNEFALALRLENRLVGMLRRSLGDRDIVFINELDYLSSLYRNDGRKLEAAFVKAKSLILAQSLHQEHLGESPFSTILGDEPEWFKKSLESEPNHLINPFDSDALSCKAKQLGKNSKIETVIPHLTLESFEKSLGLTPEAELRIEEQNEAVIEEDKSNSIQFSPAVQIEQLKSKASDKSVPLGKAAAQQCVVKLGELAPTTPARSATLNQNIRHFEMLESLRELVCSVEAACVMPLFDDCAMISSLN